MACGAPGTRPTFITPVSLPSATVAFSVVDSIVAGLIGVTQGIARAKSRRGWVKLTGNRTEGPFFLFSEMKFPGICNGKN